MTKLSRQHVIRCLDTTHHQQQQQQQQQHWGYGQSKRRAAYHAAKIKPEHIKLSV